MELSKLRVGDAERGAVIDELNEQYALGRIGATEVGIRVNAALAAETMLDLHLLVSDLPRRHPPAMDEKPTGWWKERGAHAAFTVLCLGAGSAATTVAFDSLAVGVAALIAGTCGVALGRFTKPDR